MRRVIRYASLAVVALGLMLSAWAAGAKTVVVNVGGTAYALTAVPLSYAANAAELQAQPWWGNEPLAFAISSALQYQLGDLEGGPGTTLGIPSALLAYGTDTGYVSITYWDGATENCPVDCPLEAASFFYVTGAVVASKIPTLSDWGLTALGVVLGGAGLFALRRRARRA